MVGLAVAQAAVLGGGEVDAAEVAVAVGREVRIYAEDVTNRLDTLRAAAPLARGRVERLDDSLGVVLAGGEKVWTSGRLAYEDECAALGL